MIWLATTAHLPAITVTIDETPPFVCPSNATVSITLTVTGVEAWRQADPIRVETDLSPTLVVTITGGCGISSPFETMVWVDGQITATIDITDFNDDLTVTATCEGSSAIELIPCVKVEGVEARMVQDDTKPLIDAANWDQDIWFKAVLFPSPAPAGFNYDQVYWIGASPEGDGEWAKTSEPGPGNPVIYAFLNQSHQTKEVWRVRLTVSKLKLAGTGFMEIKKDPPLDENYSAPHWDAARGADAPYPVLLKQGGKLKATATFQVEPADWPGHPSKLKATGGPVLPETATGGGPDPFDAPEIEATNPLAPTVGHEQPTLTWQYKIQESGYSDAGETQLDLYRTLIGGKTDYITVVDTACNSVTGNTAAAVRDGIWGKSSGRNVPKYKYSAMTYYYWGAGSPENITKRDLIEWGDGRCNAWADFFQACIELHSAGPTAPVQMDPATNVRLLDGDGATIAIGSGKYLNFKQGLLSQGGFTNAPTDGFNVHIGVKAGLGPNLKFYDPSYGGDSFSNYEAWENSLLHSQDVKYKDDNGDFQIGKVLNQETRDTTINDIIRPLLVP